MIDRLKKTFDSVAILILALILYFFYEELILRWSTSGRVTSPALYIALMLDAVWAIGVFSVLMLLKPGKKRRIWLWVMLILITLIFSSQTIYFKMMHTYYTFYSAENAGKVLEFTDLAIQGVLYNFPIVIWQWIPLVLWGFLSHKQLYADVEKRSFKITWIGLWLIIACFMQILGISVIQLGDKSENSPYSLYYTMDYPEFSVDNLGLITYMRLDAQRYYFGFKAKLVTYDIDESLLDQIENTTTAEPSTGTSEHEDVDGNVNGEVDGEVDDDVDGEPQEEDVIVTYDANVLNIDFGTLIGQETNKDILEMHTYFSQVEPTLKNAYTGKYKDYNLIFITAEGFSHLAIDPEITPTLYKLQQEGVNFTNFYTPLWGVSTSDGEYVATTGLIPKSGVWSYRYSRNNTMPFALGNQLLNQGYTTKAFHNHTYTYYDRHLSHPNMGYDYIGVGNGLEIKDTWPESDLEMMEVTVPEYMQESKFHTYYMTVSGHMNYNFNDNAMAYKNYDLVKNLPYSEAVQAYLATQIEFDRAMASLLSQLEKAGKLDRTLIAISADHYPYGLTHAEIDELSGELVDANFGIYKNAFLLYATNMEPLTYEKPASSLDIIPTLSNLMGLDFDSRLLMGRDLFSTQAPLVIFSNRSFITEYGSYNSKTGEFITNKDVASDVLKTYRKAISNDINAKFYFSARILETDYYSMILQNN